MSKRNRLEVIYDILKVIQDKKEIKPTPLMRFSNLSTQRFNEYIEELIEKRFVIEKDNEGRKHYILTNKGHEYLEKYSLIINFIDEFDL